MNTFARIILVSSLALAAAGWAEPNFLGVDFAETPKWEYTSFSTVHALNHGCRRYSSRHAKMPLKMPYLGFREMELSSGNSPAKSLIPTCPLALIALERYERIKDLERADRCAAAWTSNAVERLTMEYGMTMRSRADFARELCGTNGVLEFRCGTSVCSRAMDDNLPEQVMHYYIYVRALNVKMWNDVSESSQSESDGESPQCNSRESDIEVDVDI